MPTPQNGQIHPSNSSDICGVCAYRVTEVLDISGEACLGPYWTSVLLKQLTAKSKSLRDALKIISIVHILQISHSSAVMEKNENEKIT